MGTVGLKIPRARHSQKECGSQAEHRHIGASTPGTLNGTVRNLAPLAAVGSAEDHQSRGTLPPGAFHTSEPFPGCARAQPSCSSVPKSLSPEFLHQEERASPHLGPCAEEENALVYVKQTAGAHSMLSSTSQEQAHTQLLGLGFLSPWFLCTHLPSSLLWLLHHLPSMAWIPGPEPSSTIASNT